MSIYSKYILPRLLDYCCGFSGIENERLQWIPYASGKVLEIGIGSGLNLPFYRKSNISKLWGLEPSQELLDIAANVAQKGFIDVEFIKGSATNIPLADDSLDYVVMTYTMCSIVEVPLVLNEIKRVLNTSGQLLFIEHGKSPDLKINSWQNKLTPLWRLVFGGCHINKNISLLISSAGFYIHKLSCHYLPNTPKIAGYNYSGVASV